MKESFEATVKLLSCNLEIRVRVMEIAFCKAE